jgi:glyoxylate reductase
MAQKYNVLVTGKIPPDWLSELDEIACIQMWDGGESFLMPRSKMLSIISQFDAVINYTEIIADEEFIITAKKLKVIANVSIGYDNLNLPLLSEHKKWATNSPGFFNYPVAEYSLAAILILLRKLFEADASVRNGEWSSFEPGKWDGFSLKDQILGIIGLGTIGKELKKMAESIGTKVVYFNPSSRNEKGFLPFNELISISDIISIHVPLNASTKYLFDENIINNMKKGAILVNTSRGSIVELNAVITALESGQLSGAVLDVFEDEPNVPAQLKKMKNVILTPHIAGGTLNAREACVRCAVKNVAQVLKGNKPVNALNNILL